MSSWSVKSETAATKIMLKLWIAELVKMAKNRAILFFLMVQGARVQQELET